MLVSCTGAHFLSDKFRSSNQLSNFSILKMVTKSPKMTPMMMHLPAVPLYVPSTDRR